MTTSDGEDARLRRARPRHRLVPVRAAGARARPAGLLRLPHHRRPRGAARLRREPARRHGRPVRGVVVGGGLLGLEAANALPALGADDARRRVRPAADAAAGRRGRRRGAAPARSSSLGVTVRTGTATTKHRRPATAAVAGWRFADGDRARRRPRRVLRRHRPARRARPAPPASRSASAAASSSTTPAAPSDPDVYAIGECACVDGRVLRPGRPGYTMAEVVADRLLGGDGDVPRRRPVDQAQAARRRRRQLRRRVRRDARRARDRLRRPGRRRLQEARLSDDARTLLGGILVGDASRVRRAAADGRPRARRRPGARACCPAGVGAGRPATLPDDAVVCSCNNVTAGAIRGAVTRRRLHRRRPRSRRAPRPAPAAASACRWSSSSSTTELEAGRASTVSTRAVRALRATAAPELFDIVRVQRHHARSASSSPRTARGRGCEICKPAVASILASLEQRARPRRRAGRAAGHQRPLPGQHPEGRHLLGRPAHPRRRDHARAADRDRRRSPSEFGLYTKITGGQRIDLFGARVEQLPRDLAAAGRRRLRVRPRLRQGAAHGEVLRRLDLVPLRRAGLGRAWPIDARAALPRACAAPHKLKSAVSGCARECAEARGKDVGVIATEKGWNLYVGGNGGFTPAARRSCSPRTSTTRRWSATSTASSCTTSAPPTGCSAPRRGSRRSRAASTTSRAVVVDDSPRHRRRARGRDGRARRRATRTSGRRRSTTPSGCAGSRSFVNAPDDARPDARLRRASAASPVRRPPTTRERGGVLDRRHHPGGAPMTAERDADRRRPGVLARCVPLDDLAARARRRGPGRRRAGRALPHSSTARCYAVRAAATRSAAPTYGPRASSAAAATRRPSPRRCTSRSSTCAPAPASTRGGKEPGARLRTRPGDVRRRAS